LSNPKFLTWEGLFWQKLEQRAIRVISQAPLWIIRQWTKKEPWIP